MTGKRYHRRKGGSLVFPILLIVIGVLFLLDNIGLVGGIDWSTVWKLWPVIIIAMGLEILLGRRVSFGAAFLMITIVVIAGAAIWWSVIVNTGDRTTEHFEWPIDGTERAELELEVGAGELRLEGQSDMGDLLTADLELFRRNDVSASKRTNGDVTRVWIRNRKSFIFFPAFLGGDSEAWDLKLNSRIRWELDVDAGVGEARLDLSELRVNHLNLHSGIGSLYVTLPERGTLEGRIDGGIGDVHITVPRGVEARFRVDRGIGDLTTGSRFSRRGDYYETENFGRAESYIELDVDIGVGNVTIH